MWVGVDGGAIADSWPRGFDPAPALNAAHVMRFPTDAQEVLTAESILVSSYFRLPFVFSRYLP